MEYISRAQAKRDRNKGKSFEAYTRDLKRTPTGSQFIENAEVLYDFIKEGYSLTGEPITRSYLDSCYWDNFSVCGNSEDTFNLEELRLSGLSGGINPFTGEGPKSLLINPGSFYFGNSPFSFSDRFGRYMKYLIGVGKIKRVSKTGYIPVEI
jgi:hypothetical protein